MLCTLPLVVYKTLWLSFVLLSVLQDRNVSCVIYGFDILSIIYRYTMYIVCRFVGECVVG